MDEAQDLHPSQWRLLRAAVAPGPDDLFIAADPHQRIYNNRVSLASLRISVRGRSRKLSLNYRTTQEILAWAVPLARDGSGDRPGRRGGLPAGLPVPHARPRPQLQVTATRAEEFALLAERIRSWLATGIEPHAIGVAARSASLVREAREALKADGIMTASLSGRGSTQAVRAGTMHAMKGLEFQAVAVIGVEQGLVPEPASASPRKARTPSRMPRTCSGNAASCSWPAPAPGTTSTCPAPASRACSCRLMRQIRHRSDGESATPHGTEEPPDRGTASPRKLGTRELLRLREDSWEPRLRGASLVAEVDLRPDHTDQVANVLGRLYAKLQDPRIEGEPFLLQWPACLAAAMAGVAATGYHGGTYWPELWETTGFPGTSQDQGIWGRAFNRAVDRLGMATFPELPLHFVGPDLDARRHSHLLPGRLLPVAAFPSST